MEALQRGMAGPQGATVHHGDTRSMTEPEQLQPPQQDEAPREPKIIKRYTNRKLYDTVESRYVTLDEIAEMIKQGAEVKIVDNRTKDDLTSVTLAQIIFEEEKKKNQMPLSVLREIIRHPGDALSGFIQKEVTPRVASIREEAETRLDRLLRREEGGTGELKDDLLRAGQRTIEEWQRRADDRVKSLVEGVTGSLPALGSDLGTLSRRLEEIETRLAKLEAKKDVPPTQG
jgi:polyhydroxyalkanoate synthesis repressor PhaR